MLLWMHKMFLAQADHQYSLGFSKSSTSMMGARAKLKAGLHCNVLKWPVPESGGAFLTKKPDGNQGGIYQYP